MKIKIKSGVKFKIMEYGKSFDQGKTYNIKDEDADWLIEHEFAEIISPSKEVNFDFLKEETQVKSLEETQMFLQKKLSEKESFIDKSLLKSENKIVAVEKLEPLREEIKKVKEIIEEKKRGRPKKD